MISENILYFRYQLLYIYIYYIGINLFTYFHRHKNYSISVLISDFIIIEQNGIFIIYKYNMSFINHKS